MQGRNARSAYRYNYPPDVQLRNLGFRLAGGCGTGVTACCQSSAEESAGACHSTSGPRSGRGQPRQTQTGPGLGLGSRPGPRYLGRWSPARNGKASNICSRSRQVSPACPIQACTDWRTVTMSMSPRWKPARRRGKRTALGRACSCVCPIRGWRGRRGVAGCRGRTSGSRAWLPPRRGGRGGRRAPRGG